MQINTTNKGYVDEDKIAAIRAKKARTKQRKAITLTKKQKLESKEKEKKLAAQNEEIKNPKQTTIQKPLDLDKILHREKTAEVEVENEESVQQPEEILWLVLPAGVCFGKVTDDVYNDQRVISWGELDPPKQLSEKPATPVKHEEESGEKLPSSNISIQQLQEAVADDISSKKSLRARNAP